MGMLWGIIFGIIFGIIVGITCCIAFGLIFDIIFGVNDDDDNKISLSYWFPSNNLYNVINSFSFNVIELINGKIDVTIFLLFI